MPPSPILEHYFGKRYNSVSGEKRMPINHLNSISKNKVVQIQRICIGFYILILLPLLCGCQSISYYNQAVGGHMNLMAARRPVVDVLEDPQTPPEVKARLEYILSVRDFAQNELNLPVGSNYLKYVKLDRPYVVWNVFAAPEFSLTPKTWCYPVIGCAAYRAYFSEEDAHMMASSLAEEGYDVFTGGVMAYSTLGWFDDPVLSSFLRLSETQSAGLIFHELAHQLLYVPDDSAFNESFATTVEQEGIRRWLIARDEPQIFRVYLQKHEEHQEFIKLLQKYRTELVSLYQKNIEESAKRKQKTQIFDELRNEFNTTKNATGNLSRYTNWFSSSINNAKLTSVATYHDLVPGFQTLVQNNDGDLQQFYRECQNIAKLKPDERLRILEQQSVTD